MTIPSLFRAVLSSTIAAIPYLSRLGGEIPGLFPKIINCLNSEPPRASAATVGSITAVVQLIPRIFACARRCGVPVVALWAIFCPFAQGSALRPYLPRIATQARQAPRCPRLLYSLSIIPVCVPRQVARRLTSHFPLGRLATLHCPVHGLRSRPLGVDLRRSTTDCLWH